MKQTNKYIKYTEYLNRENYIKSIKKNGFKIIYKKNRFKLICGLVCLSIAIIPNGTGFILYPISFFLLGIGLNDILKFKENLKFKIYERFNK